jgi:aspartyl-tRNA(Asn)/glutamyl-tRNA(Gln) amidotransferase subunit C
VKISRDILLHTADLARLDLSSLSEGELDGLAGQLDAIVAHVAQLDAIDTRDVPETTHAVPLPTHTRADTIEVRLTRDAVMANAPEVDDGYFVVPRVIAVDDGGEG